VFKFGVQGAVWSSVIISCVAAMATVLAVRRVSARHPEGDPTSARTLVSYGVRAYPAGITGYFNYRADTFLIQALLIQSSGPLGLYSMAVTMAELIFYIPDAVSTIFLPMVAGSSPEKANATLGMVSRLTMLITVGAALALIPVAWIGLHLVLPGFVDCMPAFLVLLPGVVSLSLSKVMTSYVAGRGRPGSISMGGAVALVVNLVANVVLIPQLGIVGASLASLLSYTAMALIMLVVACRLSGLSPLELVVPRKSELALLKGIALQTLARVTARTRG
jgi:O-antigen/teichoic acid export membrane protein